jgi:hypothetical protein
MKMFQKIQELIDDPDALVFVLIDEVGNDTEIVFFMLSSVHLYSVLV